MEVFNRHYQDHVLDIPETHIGGTYEPSLRRHSWTEEQKEKLKDLSWNDVIVEVFSIVAEKGEKNIADGKPTLYLSQMPDFLSRSESEIARKFLAKRAGSGGQFSEYNFASVHHVMTWLSRLQVGIRTRRGFEETDLDKGTSRIRTLLEVDREPGTDSWIVRWSDPDVTLMKHKLEDLRSDMDDVVKGGVRNPDRVEKRLGSKIEDEESVAPKKTRQQLLTDFRSRSFFSHDRLNGYNEDHLDQLMSFLSETDRPKPSMYRDHGFPSIKYDFVMTGEAKACKEKRLGERFGPVDPDEAMIQGDDRTNSNRDWRDKDPFVAQMHAEISMKQEDPDYLPLWPVRDEVYRRKYEKAVFVDDIHTFLDDPNEESEVKALLEKELCCSFPKCRRMVQSNFASCFVCLKPYCPTHSWGDYSTHGTFRCEDDTHSCERLIYWLGSSHCLDPQTGHPIARRTAEDAKDLIDHAKTTMPRDQVVSRSMEIAHAIIFRLFDAMLPNFIHLSCWNHQELKHPVVFSATVFDLHLDKCLESETKENKVDKRMAKANRKGAEKKCRKGLEQYIQAGGDHRSPRRVAADLHDSHPEIQEGDSGSELKRLWIQFVHRVKVARTEAESDWSAIRLDIINGLLKLQGETDQAEGHRQTSPKRATTRDRKDGSEGHSTIWFDGEPISASDPTVFVSLLRRLASQVSGRRSGPPTKSNAGAISVVYRGVEVSANDANLVSNIIAGAMNAE